MTLTPLDWRKVCQTELQDDTWLSCPQLSVTVDYDLRRDGLPAMVIRAVCLSQMKEWTSR